MSRKPASGAPAQWPSSDRVQIERVDVLSDSWYTLRRFTFTYRRRDGTEQRQQREAYDRGNGAVILLYDKARGTILLTRQFRLPAFVSGHPDGMLLELPAGLLDDDDPATAIRREAEEETGYRVKDVKEVLVAYMSPGSVTERLHFFVAEYDPAWCDVLYERREIFEAHNKGLSFVPAGDFPWFRGTWSRNGRRVLAQNAEVTIYPWKDSPAHIDEVVEHARRFLKKHEPVAA